MLYFKLHVNVNYIHAINAARYGHVEKPLTLSEKFQENPLLCISIFSIPVSREKYVHKRHVNKGGLSHKYQTTSAKDVSIPGRALCHGRQTHSQSEPVYSVVD